jgi:periplasmic protein TonB
VERVNQRQGFLVSAILHLTILMILVSHPPIPRGNREDKIDPSTLERKDLVFLPPPAVLRQLAPRPIPPRPAAPATPAPAPTPPPTDATKKDGVSAGPKSPFRTKGPIDLDDLNPAKGIPSPRPLSTPLPAPSKAPPGPDAADAGGSKAVPGGAGLRLPPGLGRDLPRGRDGAPARPGPIGQSIPGAVQRLEERLERAADLGAPTGTGQKTSGFYFDPQGADFTQWLSRLNNELDRNWIAPQPALMGFHGTVAFEMTIERDGTLSSLRMIRSTGNAALDRSVRNAIIGSRLLPLPNDYRPPRVTGTLTISINEALAGS